MSGPLNLEVQDQEEEPARAFGFEGQWGLVVKLPELGEIETSLLKGTLRHSCTRTKGKSSNFLGAWARPSCLSCPKDMTQMAS